MKYYAGVGSRETPPEIQELMTDIARELEDDGWILRSGAAEGADQAFESGVYNPANKEIYIPWEGFQKRRSGVDGVVPLDQCNKREACAIASTLHPIWSKLTGGAKSLHARNTYQVLGKDLDTPSKFLVCWAPVDKHGVPKGGTRTAWVLAQRENIPRFNLKNEEDRRRIEKWLHL